MTIQNLVPDPFHGTKADVSIGEYLTTGHKKNYHDTRKSAYVFSPEH